MVPQRGTPPPTQATYLLRAVATPDQL
jgi:coiled-coil domain-containing protein 61